MKIRGVAALLAGAIASGLSLFGCGGGPVAPETAFVGSSSGNTIPLVAGIPRTVTLFATSVNAAEATQSSTLSYTNTAGSSVTSSINPSTVTLPAVGSTVTSSLTLSIDRGATAGTYPGEIRRTSTYSENEQVDGVRAIFHAPLDIEVVPFLLDMTMNSAISVLPGGSSEGSITVTPEGAVPAGIYTASLDNIPPGLHMEVSPAQITFTAADTNPQTLRVTVAADSGLATGSYQTATLAVTNGVNSYTLNVPVTVSTSLPDNVALTVTPPSRQIFAGVVTDPFQLTVESRNDFEGEASIEFDDLPDGVVLFPPDNPHTVAVSTTEPGHYQFAFRWSGTVVPDPLVIPIKVTANGVTTRTSVQLTRTAALKRKKP